MCPSLGLSLNSYNTMFKPTLAVFLVYWLADELINHGPLKPYVYGPDLAHNHGHDDHHDSAAYGHESEAVKMAKARAHRDD